MRNKTEKSQTQNFFLGEHPVNFHEKNTPDDNFSTVQPIFTSSIPVNAAQHAEQSQNIKNSKFYFRGAPGEFL